jgi:hypothetical protein
MSVICDRLVAWARTDPRRLLGSEDLGALFHRLLALSNIEDSLLHSGAAGARSAAGAEAAVAGGNRVGDDGQLDAGLAMAVCLEILEPSVVVAHGDVGKSFLRQSMQAVVPVVMDSNAKVRLAGLRFVEQMLLAWDRSGHFVVLGALLAEEEFAWPQRILALMQDAAGDEEKANVHTPSSTRPLSLPR